VDRGEGEELAKNGQLRTEEEGVKKLAKNVCSTQYGLFV